MGILASLLLDIAEGVCTFASPQTDGIGVFLCRLQKEVPYIATSFLGCKTLNSIHGGDREILTGFRIQAFGFSHIDQAREIRGDMELGIKVRGYCRTSSKRRRGSSCIVSIEKFISHWAESE